MKLKALQDIFLGCTSISASTFATIAIFHSIKTMNIFNYLVRENGQYIVYSPLGPLMTISIVANAIFNRWSFLQTGQGQIDKLAVLTVSFFSTHVLHSIAEQGNQIAAYVLTTLTIFQIGVGFFYGIYPFTQNLKEYNTKNLLIT